MVDIIKSKNDKKLYRHLVLESGLSVFLISDPEIKADAAAKEQQAAGKRKRAAHEDEGSDEEAMEEDDEDEEEGSGSGSEEGSSGSGSGSEDEDEDEDGSEEGDEDMSDAEEDGSGSEGGKGKKGKGGRAAGGTAAPVKRAAAAMAVGVGSLSDPPHMQGLSHYLEHMLFMGSAKYPDENDYDDFLTKHGGSSNAFTELEYTNYHLEVAPEHLKGALDRFAQFFISPLFAPGSLEREVLAVDSEFGGVQQNDAARASQLMCHTAKEGHAFNKFTWGNKRSLWDEPLAAGVDVRGEIIKYYKEQYSAERMTLVVLGGESLDTLESWVREIFVGLPVGTGPRRSFEGVGAPFEGRKLYMMPAVRDMHEVCLTFVLPPLGKRYASKAEHTIAHLVGHEGPGSLLSLLKARGWATEVCAGVEEDGFSQNSGAFLFGVTITLTDAGLAAGPGFGLAPIALTFQYLNMLREKGPQEWVWQELKAMAEMKFMFQEEEEAMDMVTRVASSMQFYPPQHVLAAEYLHEKYDPKLTAELLHSCMHPSSVLRVDLLTRSFTDLKPSLAKYAKQATGKELQGGTEPWFGMEAAWMELPEDLCKAWATEPTAPELHLPPPNPYIPTDFTLRHPPAKAAPGANGAAGSTGAAGQSPLEQELSQLAASLGLPVVLATPPDMVLDEPGLRVWHKPDRAFGTPRACAYFRLWSPAWCDTARAAALSHLALKMLEDELNEDAYLADVAGLHYNTSPEGQAGIELKVEGFSHRLPRLAARLFSALAAADFPKASWGPVKEALERKYRNTGMQVPKHANYQRLYALCARTWHWTEVQPHIEAAAKSDIQPFLRSVLANCHLEVFVHGNMSVGEAKEVATSCRATLGAGCVLPATARFRDQCVALPQGRELLHAQPVRNAEEECCCVESYYQVGPAASAKERALLDLADQLLHEPAYNQLRTQEQLGYTVHTGTRLTHGVLGFCVVVVSRRLPPRQVDARVEAFLAAFREKLAAMTPDELEKQKSSLSAHKLARDRALADESIRHWDHIWNQRYDFFAREAEVGALQALTLADVQAWYDTYLLPGAPSRRKLSVHVVPSKACDAAGSVPPDGTFPSAQAVPGAGAQEAEGAAAQGELPEVPIEVVSDLKGLKQRVELFPLLLGKEPPVGGVQGLQQGGKGGKK